MNKTIENLQKKFLGRHYPQYKFFETLHYFHEKIMHHKDYYEDDEEICKTCWNHYKRNERYGRGG